MAALAALPPALRRDPSVDYYEGCFMVTLNVRDVCPVLGMMAGHPMAADDSPDAPHVELSALGEQVLQCWQQIPQYYPNVELLEAQVMPEHFHGLLRIRRVDKKPLGRVIGGFMIGCTHAYWDCLGIEWRGSNQLPPQQDSQHRKSKRGDALFVRGYNDVVAIDEKDVESEAKYIRDNARRRIIKSGYPDRFGVARQLRTHSWSLDVALGTLTADPYIGRHRDAYEEARLALLPRLRAEADGRIALDLVGDRSLLTQHRLLPLICHRADAGRFEEQKAAVMREARAGAVIVSAFISPRERDIYHKLLLERLPVIEIMDNGFSQRYKPGGRSFYACAEARLLQVTTWSYLYQHETRVSREMCLVMNQLARVICKADDRWWTSV